ncbi:MAG: hypothetical protein HY400_02920 [Elusimicrobia bacterium]|nr:hypothetical protein [Elusimicrobiota bacterium]
MNKNCELGFSISELLVVVLMIIILVGIAQPRYRKTLETSSAERAVGMVQAIGKAHKMFRLDNNRYMNASGAIIFSFNNANCNVACPGTYPTGGAPAFQACKYLIGCHYLSEYNWNADGWWFFLCDPAVSSGACGSGAVAAASRKWAGPAPPATLTTPYMFWNYRVMEDGRLLVGGGAPNPR